MLVVQTLHPRTCNQECIQRKCAMEVSGDVVKCQQHCIDVCDKHRHLIGDYVTVLHIHADEETRWFLYDLGITEQPTNQDLHADVRPRRRRLSLVSLTLLEIPLGKRNVWSKTWGSDQGGATASLTLTNTVYVLISMFDIKFEAASQNVARFNGYFLGHEFSLLAAGAELLMGFGSFRGYLCCVCLHCCSHRTCSA